MMAQKHNSPASEPELSEVKKELIDQILDQMERMGRTMRDEVPQEWEKFDLTVHQLRALLLLDVEPMRMSDLAAQMGSSLSSVTAMVDRLSEKGLVQRVHDTADRRVVRCELTSAGREELQRLWRIERAQMEGVSRFLNEDELREVLQAIEKLSRAFDEHAAWRKRSNPSPDG